MLTASGRVIDFLDPRPSDIFILDIAQALSEESRFNGHTYGFYSVAQHSWLVSCNVPQEHALEGLLHDATEAYMKDIPKPLKNLLPDYQEIENRLECVIRSRFGLPPKPSEEVKRADMQALATERRDLIKRDNADIWGSLKGVDPWEKRISPMSPNHSMAVFISRFLELVEPA